MSGIVGGVRSKSGILNSINSPTFGGVSTFPAGSATAPSITWAGDTNTGLFSPGADHVGITTGGTRRLKVDGSGETQLEGIGLSDPRIGEWCHAKLTSSHSGQNTGAVRSPTGYDTGGASQENTNTSIFDVGTYGIQTKIAGYYQFVLTTYTTSFSANAYFENYMTRRDTGGSEHTMSVAYSIDDYHTDESWRTITTVFPLLCPVNNWYRVALYIQAGSITMNGGGTKLWLQYLRAS